MKVEFVLKKVNAWKLEHTCTSLQDRANAICFRQECF